MVDDTELERLRDLNAPAPRAAAKARALAAARQAFDAENSFASAQGSKRRPRLMGRFHTIWRETMQKRLIPAPALTALIALPVAGYTAFHLMQEGAIRLGGDLTDGPVVRLDKQVASPKEKEAAERADDEQLIQAPEPAYAPLAEAPAAAPQFAPSLDASGLIAPAPSAGSQRMLLKSDRGNRAAAPAMADRSAGVPAPIDVLPQAEQERDRLEEFRTNPVHSAATDPVSTFSIDVDTASYAFVRRSLKEGILPRPDTVRVEEMVNYFPYDWEGPATSATPFNSDVTVMPTPWDEHTKLMHVAIKGYDVQPSEQPRANLVFLIDVSGSMNEPDKLPLLKSAFRLLVSKLGPDDTVSIVTYAGEAGTVLEPTRASERAKILSAIDQLAPGGSTAGEAGIREAYRLAEGSFVKGGVNRVMLATDGDFNVGQTDDDDLRRLVEEKRRSGVFLSVLGFGRGNLNDRMMQAIAQNGNGAAAYVDTLAEAEKVLVQEASSTLFPIAKDVKIQVEFNPAAVSEYRLIGYETRALAREDFNNDRVDAGEIGSGHSVTAIYEVTPKGSPAETMDPLRYGEASTQNGGVANADEYAFVKIRYKLPAKDVSTLIEAPVTKANEVASFDAAGADQRFSVAVAAFGQKLRGADQTASFGYDRIAGIASAARGADPYGYRAEFLSLVRLASALDAGNR
ncbi:von Willebrand factor type A domain-containing protein [Mesorhizobium sp. ZMM04-5]|uniref:von Willebrand factor type A domain-containing protein n=1 Tax=Mesorhizobium marinum TaxID=3228790 RepID=A0ABV3QWG4_9HYPH